MMALALAEKNRSQDYIQRISVPWPPPRDVEAVCVWDLRHLCSSWAWASWISRMAGLGAYYHGQAPKS